MTRNLALATLAFGLLTSTAIADPIEGNWKRPNGIIVKFAPCGDGFCATAVTGPHAGGSAGKLSPSNAGKYAGTLTDLESNKTYSGKGAINGATLTVSGCVLGLFCRSEAWARQ